MSAIFPLLLLLIFAACVGFSQHEGMWANAIRFINVVTAALLATSFFEPLAKLLEENVYRGMTYVWDFISLWALFCVFLILFRILTGRVSHVKVRFKAVADRAGSVNFAILTGIVMVCFVTMTLHTAPLGKTSFWGGFDADEEGTWGLKPGHKWLRLTEVLSKGAYRSGEEFDGRRFLLTYAERRAALDSHVRSSSGGPRALLVNNAPKR
jgi:hypothetical protein